MDIVPLKSNPKPHEDVLEPIKKARADYVYERNLMINEMMRNKSARR